MSLVGSGRALVRVALCLLLATCSAGLEAAAPRVNVLSVNLNPLIDRASHSPAPLETCAADPKQLRPAAPDFAGRRTLLR